MAVWCAFPNEPSLSRHLYCRLHHGNVNSVPVFYYFLLLYVCEFNAVEISFLKVEGMRGGGQRAWASFTVSILFWVYLSAH
jgi:hypothetical protein